MAGGILYLVASPIGNLEDITFRAVRVLKESDWIACEDTRHTRILLNHYGIGKPLVSYHDHNESERAPELIARLLAGSSGSLISDAGMPLVADPGYRLVHAAVAEGISVQPIPGPSAIVTALAASGLPTDSFRFGGFLPPKSGQRAHALEALRDDRSTLIFFEAPHRILETLADIESILGARPVVVARELTKTHEEFLRGTARQILEILSARPSVQRRDYRADREGGQARAAACGRSIRGRSGRRAHGRGFGAHGRDQGGSPEPWIIEARCVPAVESGHLAS